MNFVQRNNRVDGKFVEKPQRTKAPVCACGNKYMKTRENQTKCIRCIYRPEESPHQ